MKTGTLFLLGSLLAWQVTAQNNASKHLNFGTGVGVINPLGLDKTIYRNYSSVVHYTIELEKEIGKKGAWQTGLQFSMLSMSVDAVIHSNNHLAVAPDSIKYAAINQMSLQVPLRYRLYKSEERDGKFYQFGATFGYNFNNIYTYRYKNEDKEQTISNVQPYMCMAHIGLGSRINKKHVWYIDMSIPVTPYFKQAHASSLYPLQLSFNLLL